MKIEEVNGEKLRQIARDIIYREEHGVWPTSTVCRTLGDVSKTFGDESCPEWVFEITDPPQGALDINRFEIVRIRNAQDAALKEIVRRFANGIIS